MGLQSFDVVIAYDKAEMNNSYDQGKREIVNRYDFKGTAAQLEWLDEQKSGFKITGSSEWQVDAIVDIIRKKLAARGQSQKLLDTSHELVTTNLKVTKEVPFKQTLSPENAKKITGLIRESFPKLKTQIQGDAVRVMGSSRDELQAAILLIKQHDLDLPLGFTNYR